MHDLKLVSFEFSTMNKCMITLRQSSAKTRWCWFFRSVDNSNMYLAFDQSRGGSVLGPNLGHFVPQSPALLTVPLPLGNQYFHLNFNQMKTSVSYFSQVVRSTASPLCQKLFLSKSKVFDFIVGACLDFFWTSKLINITFNCTLL